MNYRDILNNPDSIELLSYEEIEEILLQAKYVFEKEKALLEPKKDRFVFVGDTHGDFETTKSIIRNYLDKNCIVFLGDYIDREPNKWGSVYNIIYLLILKICYPSKIYLLKGNHECNYIIPCFPYEFEFELMEKYEKEHLHEGFINVFREIPIMFYGNKVFAAHGGIIKNANLDVLRCIDKNDKKAIELIAWSDPAVSNTYRGCGYKFSQYDLVKFLDNIKAKIFIRGHDYNTLGFSIYNDRCLTIFSSKRYKDMGNGGVLVAKVRKEICCIDDICVEDISSGKPEKYNIAKL